MSEWLDLSEWLNWVWRGIVFLLGAALIGWVLAMIATVLSEVKAWFDWKGREDE